MANSQGDQALKGAKADRTLVIAHKKGCKCKFTFLCRVVAEAVLCLGHAADKENGSSVHSHSKF
eukprot:1143589-Pelagomonas_calceolata.AAC.4